MRNLRGMERVAAVSAPPPPLHWYVGWCCLQCDVVAMHVLQLLLSLHKGVAQLLILHTKDIRRGHSS